MKVRALAFLAGALLVSVPAFRAEAQATAGFSEYIIPGNEGQVTETLATSTQLGLYYVFNQLDTGGTPTSANMHTVITVTAWAPNTAVYYDHWEDGLDFDPNNPTTADETVSLATMGALQNFESANFAIPVAATTPGTGCNTLGTCVYDGGDRIFVAGGAVTVTRAGWNEERGVGNQAVAWEIYPVRPQLTTYVVPFGENLGIDAFERVFVLIQATADGTTFQVDVDANGSFDLLNANRDATKSGPGDTDTVTLNAGQTFLLDAVSACPTGANCTANPGVTNQILTGALIQGSSTLQVKYIAGNDNSNYCARGLSSFPRGYWTKSYYAPLDQRGTGNGTGTDYILHNPHGSPLLVTWESRTASGTFTIGPGSTVRYGAQVGAVLPVDSGLYFSAPDVFWGVGLGDWNGAAYEWGYSLLPSTFLSAEHFLGWAPGFVGGTGTARYDDVGVFLVAAQDNTTLFVDFDSDGTADQTYTLNRLESQFIFDPNDGNMTGAHIWGTGEFTLAYGENADTASTSTPSLDLGYVGIPGTDFLSLVLGVEKTANPQVVPTDAGSTTEFTIVAGTQEYSLDGLEIVDTLPPGWAYVPGLTTITRPDLTTSNADPATITGTGTLADPYVLTWLTADLAPSGMAPNQQVSVKFTAQTTAALAVGTLSRNRVVATGSRTVGDPEVEQTFSATDFTYVTSGALAIAKSSSAPIPLYPGDQFGYTVVVSNPAGSPTQTGVSIFDATPAGTTYVASSGQVTCELPRNVRDEFAAVSYANDGPNNTDTWAGDWAETDALGGGAASGLASVTAAALRLAQAENVRDEFTTNDSYTGNNGSSNWTGPWTEADAYGGGGTGANGGYALVTANVLRLRALPTSNVRDEFTTNGSYSGNYGSANWATSWDETNDDDSATGGTIYVSGPGNNLWFDEAQVGDSISRTTNIPAGISTATISMGVTDGGIDAGETLVVEYQVDGGLWEALGTFDGNAGWDIGPPWDISIDSGAATIALRLSAGGNNYDNNDDVQIDNVDISFFAAATGTQVQRAADLTGAASASLTFTAAVAGLEAADTLVVEASSSASGPFTTLATYTAGVPSAPGPYDLSAYISATTTIRFRVTGGYDAAGETFSIDNVDITYRRTAPEIQRTVDLTGAAEPSLSFTTTPANLEAGDTLVVEASSSASGPFTTLATYAAGTPTPAGPYDLTPYISSTTTIRFRITGGYDQTNESFSFDNVNIAFFRAATFASGAPPSFLASSAGCRIISGGTVTLTFDVTVDDPFPTGSNLITNTAATTTAQFPIQITASVTDQVTVPTLLSATVAGRVWFDADGDGVQDLGEPGISNVQVTLKDQFGTPVATLTTDVNGRYLFTGVTPGNGYYVEVQSGLPAGVQQSFPVGRSDNRTGSFNLAAGQNFTGADLGYEPLPATVSFGDLVWVDADSDGVRDAGEVGLGGVTVSLYRDTNGDGFLQPGTDELVTTTTSASDGSYLFAGQTPGSTYFVSATTPGGFTSTGDTVYRFTSTTAGTAYLTADFGFVGTTYTLSDRIWNDADQDGVFDAGENGIAGVTVEILDASLNVIGLTTTAADGTFTFSGLPGSGANYTTRISDTGGVLTNFTGTTPYALARLRSEPNLVADRDRTAAPSYGFFAARSIGDTVFFDVNGDGDQDAGEAGIPGIVVGLYSDLDNDGVIDGGEPLVGTLTTDAAGRYLFSGLSDGNYIVSVPPLTGYDYTGTGGAADSDPGTAGVQRQAAMTGGANVLDIDFGFEAQTPASVTGTIWNDGNRDGLIGGSEGRLAGVTVDILDGTTVVATVTTDAAGNYTFSGLAAGDYTIRVTDTAGILNGFSTTYEATEGTTGPFDNEEDVTLAAGSNTGPRFGYAFPTPTWVSVARLGATAAGGVVTVEWETTQEVGAVGFDLYRLDPGTGGWVRVNESLLPALLGHPEGGTYAVQDRAAPLAGPLTYRLVEVDWQDARHEHGPYRVDELLTGAPSFEAYRRAPREVPLETRERVRAAERARDAATVAAPVGRAGRVKLLTKGSGVVYVDVDSLAGLLVMPRERLAEMVAGGRVALRHRGALVPYIPAALGDGFYFYAEAVESPYTDENAYFLSVQWGLRMPSRAATTGGAPAASFPAEARGEVDRIPLPLLFQDPEADFYAWEDLFAGYAVYDTKSVTTTLQGVAGTGNPTLTVSLLGGSSTAAPADHHVRITWNGRDVGEAVWDGAVPHVATIPLLPSDLLEGVNTLTVRALLGAGVSQSAVYLDSFDVTYDRLFRATGDPLSFPLEPGTEATVTGLGTSRLVVLDVTAPRSPVRVTGLTPFAAGDGTWSLRLANAGAEARSYVLLDPTRAALPAGLSLMASPELSSPSNRADYVLIAPTSLVATAETLADYRRSQGLETMVVDLEAVYDEFDHGLATPTAIRQFLAHAASTWSRPPQYATLVGRGTFDYRNVQGVGDNVMPTMLASTPYGLVASDVSFASVSSTPGPGLKAIGRIPVLTPQELADYVAKIQAHEGAPAGAWQNRLLLVADNADVGGSFNADSDAIGAIAPGSFQSTKVYLPAYSSANARTAIQSAVNSGTLVFNYIGHGGPDRLAGENIFNKTDVPLLSNAGQLPVFLAMTCSTGNFAIPGFPSLAESLVLWKSGGAYVAWAPSGLSLNDGATALNEAFFRGAFVDGEKVLGLLCTKSIEELDGGGPTGFMKSIYNLLGEPVSRLP
jgi:uncharacterized repeat protein (TIGR01451 family)